MSLSRRALFGAFGAERSAETAALITARGREALVAELGPLAGEASVIMPPQNGEIRISSNENPFGPSDRALTALRNAFDGAGRYPMNVDPGLGGLTEAIASRNGAEASNVVLGAGSGELLKAVAQKYCDADRHLVTATPTYLQTSRVASFQGAEVKAIPLDSYGKLDLDGMAAAAEGAGMIFVCNPNNPTGTVHSGSDIREFVNVVRRMSPDTVIHFDEAYHEYVTDPAYESALEMSLETPNVFVTRTFSKCYGMAGLRIGYGVGTTELIAAVTPLTMFVSPNVVGLAAAHAALHEDGFVARERERNTAAKKVTVDFFKEAGFEVMDSQTNFIFVNIRRPAADFRNDCRQQNVRVGRDFPPMEKTHARISIGTMDEMRRAIPVFASALGVPTNVGRRG